MTTDKSERPEKREREDRYAAPARADWSAPQGSGDQNRVLVALVAGLLLGAFLVYFMGRYRIIGEQEYALLVAKAAGVEAGAKTAAAAPPPATTPPPQQPQGQPGGDGQPPAGYNPTGELVGAQQQFDYTGSAVQGPGGAAVTVAVFSDFQCPACAQWAPAVKDVLTTHKDKVRLVFKHLPLPNHTSARPAAIAAEAAGKQGKFWEMHDLLFQNQGDLNRQGFVKMATQLGLDAARFEKDLDDPELAGRVTRDFREAERAQMPGTPTFYINGRRADVGNPSQLTVLLEKVVAGKS
jgi:protein-disulfide isomerase